MAFRYNNMEKELKTAAQFNDPLSAEITAGMLRANGIPALVFGQASSYPSINAVLNSVEVKVNPEDYEAALELINKTDSSEDAFSDPV